MTFNEEIEKEIKDFVNKMETVYYFPNSNYGVDFLAYGKKSTKN